MEPINVRFTLDEQQQAVREKTIASLRANPAIQALIQKHNLDPKIIETHSARLSRWLSNRERCQRCQGLTGCTMKVRGRQLELEVDEQGHIDEVYVPCRYARQEQESRKHESKFVCSHLQPQDSQITFAWISAQPGFSKEPRDYIACYGEVMSAAVQSHGLFLYGQPGTGKSTLLMAAANQCAMNGQSVAFVRVPLLVAQIKENLKDDEWRRKTLATLRHVDVLFLDDFGSESATSWTRDEILFPLLDERMNAHRKTFFASNLAPHELEGRYAFGTEGYALVPARRLMERIRTLARPVELKGNSRRVCG